MNYLLQIVLFLIVLSIGLTLGAVPAVIAFVVGLLVLKSYHSRTSV